MPSNMLDTDSRFPSLEPEQSVDERFFEVKNYLYMLLEQLRYTLSHLGSENLNQTEVIQWLRDEGVADEEQIVEELIPQIQDVTAPIVNNYIQDYAAPIIENQTTTVIQQQVPGIIRQQTPLIIKNIVTQSFITDELNASYGSIADLTVDRLRTDYLRARKYLQSDTSDINYIYIHDEVIELRTASVSSTTPVQLTWDQQAFWWTDANHTAMTRTQTEYPVLVYQYSEYVKAKLAFLQNSGGTYLPTLVLGAGDGSGNDKARLLKDVGGLDLLYKAGSGAEIGVRCLLSGYMDLYGLRKTTALDFSNWANGSFSETVDGNITEQYAVTFDTLGRPAAITDGAGHVCAITWPQAQQAGGGE